MTNVVVGVKKYFFLAKPLPKVCFYVSRNSSLFVLLGLVLVSFWPTAEESATLHYGDAESAAAFVWRSLPSRVFVIFQ